MRQAILCPSPQASPSILQLTYGPISHARGTAEQTMLKLARLKAPAGIEPRNSIFPVGEGGVFERVCAICTGQTPGESNTGPWRWYAIPVSQAEFHALVLPQPQALPGFRVLDLTLIAVWPQSGYAVALVTHETAGEILQTLCKYAPDSNRWTPLPPTNNAPGRDPLSFAGAAIGDSLYVAGGQEAGRRRPIAAAERFDLRTDRWEALPRMRAGRSFGKGFALDGQFFVVHNSPGRRNPLDGSAEIFDPATNEWSFVPQFLPPHTERFSVAILRNELYMVAWSTLAPWGTLLRYNKNSIFHEWIPLGDVPCKEDLFSPLRVLMAVGSELWVVENRGPVIPAATMNIPGNQNNAYCRVMHRSDQVSCGTSVWPIFAGPSYWPDEDLHIRWDAKRLIYACKVDGTDAEGPPRWRTIPIFGQ